MEIKENVAIIQLKSQSTKRHKSSRNKTLSIFVLAVRFDSMGNPKEEKNCLFNDLT